MSWRHSISITCFTTNSKKSWDQLIHEDFNQAGSTYKSNLTGLTRLVLVRFALRSVWFQYYPSDVNGGETNSSPLELLYISQMCVNIMNSLISQKHKKRRAFFLYNAALEVREMLLKNAALNNLVPCIDTPRHVAVPRAHIEN